MIAKRPLLAEFELLVMLAIARLGDDAYGASIQREIEDRASRPVSIGAVYATLGRLGDKKFVSHRVTDPLPVKGGRSRKIYQLSPRGRLALSQRAGAITSMLDGLDLAADPPRGSR